MAISQTSSPKQGTFLKSGCFPWSKKENSLKNLLVVRGMSTMTEKAKRERRETERQRDRETERERERERDIYIYRYIYR